MAPLANQYVHLHTAVAKYCLIYWYWDSLKWIDALNGNKFIKLQTGHGWYPGSNFGGIPEKHSGE